MKSKIGTAKKMVAKGLGGAINPGVTDLAIPEKEKQIASNLASSVAGKAALLKVVDDASTSQANELLLAVKEMKEKVQERRDLIVKPLKLHIAVLENLFKPAKEELERADIELRRKVLAYRAKVAAVANEKRSKLMEEAQEAQEDGDQEKAEEIACEALAVSAPARVMAVTTGQVATRTVWKYEIVDVGAVPDEYWSLDGQKISSAVKAGARTIPGVNIYSEEGLAVGGR